MPNKINFMIWLLIGSLLIFIASFFYIGSQEQLQEQLEHHLAGFYWGRVLAGTAIGIIWSPLSFLGYKAFIKKAYLQKSFLNYTGASVIVYIFVSMLAAGVFIYLAGIN